MKQGARSCGGAQFNEQRPLAAGAAVKWKNQYGRL